MREIILSFFAIAVLFQGAVNSDLARSKRGVSTRAFIYEVRAFGAKGDGKTLDTRAINKAIETAATAGGGTINFPEGAYLSVSIHLRSNITLHLDQGATILAADPVPGKVTYDLPESNEWDMYQDFGHVTGRTV